MKPQSTILASAKLNQTEAAKALGVSLSTFKRMVSAGTAPAPIFIGDQKRWLETDLENWLIQQNPQLKHALELKQQADALLAKMKAKKQQAPRLQAVA